MILHPLPRRVLPFAGLGFCAALLAAGWLFAASSGVAAGPVMSAPPPAASKPPVIKVIAVAPLPPAPKPEKKTTISSLRPPVPLLGPRHSEFFDNPEPAASTAATAPTIASLATDAMQADAGLPAASQAAKASIEADGYKNVSALVKGPDGTWLGYAMRGPTRVGIRVDAAGNVSAD